MRKITVMIVDSQSFFTAEVRRILSQGNSSDAIEILECDPGENGNEAIAQIAENSPNIVLLDIGYPFCTGLELEKRITRSYPGSCIVVLSTNPEEDDVSYLKSSKAVRWPT